LFLILIIFLVGCSSIAPKTITWIDADGSVLGTSALTYGEVPYFDLPLDTVAWDYTNWSPEIQPVTKNAIYTANRTPKTSYFVGNVFQIVVFNLGNIPINTGSGFVFNDLGWFITNNHVMEDGYFAQAIFDIPDVEKGESYTKFDIERASYRHEDKDVFIGRITDYYLIKDNYYQDFTFTTDYEISDKTYSVGYPNSSINLQINAGVVESDLSSIYDKVYSGITYIGSSSYIAPGSSGGVLLNQNLNVLGMTTIGITDDDGEFLLGGAIEAFNYINLISNVKNSDLLNYALFLHPDEKEFIGYYIEAMEDEDAVRQEFGDYARYTYTWEEEGTNNTEEDYSNNSSFQIDSDMWIEFEETYYWETGDRKEISFYGYYSVTEKLKNFTYEFKYTWEDGKYYTLTSDNINYSSNIGLTLNQYTTTKSYGYVISTSNIEYAKENFNSIYEWLTEDMARFE